MTLDEKRQQRALLLLECEEAENDLNHCIEHARRYADALRNVLSVVDHAVRDGNKPPRDKSYTSALDTPSMSVLEREPFYREVMNLEPAKNAVEAIEQAKTKLHDLKIRKSRLDGTSFSS